MIKHRRRLRKPYYKEPYEVCHLCGKNLPATDVLRGHQEIVRTCFQVKEGKVWRSKPMAICRECWDKM